MRLSAGRTLLYNVVFLLAFGTAYADDDFSTFKVPEAISPDVSAAVDTFQKPAIDKDKYDQFLKKEKDLIEIYEKHYGPIDAPKSVAKAKEYNCENTVEVSYYFSFSMPDSSIQSAVDESLKLRDKCIKVKMYLRGLVNNDLKETIKTFYTLAKANPEDLPVIIDPPRFRKENIQNAPTTIINGKRYLGDMKITGIINNIDTLKEGKVATTYPIIEEDLAELFKKRAPMATKHMQEYVDSGAVKKKFQLTRYNGTFSEAKEKRVYYIDPTYTLQEDILDHKGLVHIRAGAKANPLDNIKVGKYIFINGNKPKEVAFALKGKYRSIILMSGDALTLREKYGVPFYHVNDELIQFFQIKKVPLHIEQEGRLIRATEQPV